MNVSFRQVFLWYFREHYLNLFRVLEGLIRTFNYFIEAKMGDFYSIRYYRILKLLVRSKFLGQTFLAIYSREMSILGPIQRILDPIWAEQRPEIVCQIIDLRQSGSDWVEFWIFIDSGDFIGRRSASVSFAGLIVLVLYVVMFISGNVVILKSREGATVGVVEVIEVTEVNSSALVVISLCGDGVKSNDSIVIGAYFGFEICVIIFIPWLQTYHCIYDGVTVYSIDSSDAVLKDDLNDDLLIIARQFYRLISNPNSCVESSFWSTVFKSGSVA